MLGPRPCLVRSLAGEDARALFNGVAAHAIPPLPLVSAEPD